MVLDHNVEDYLTGINCQIRGHINRSTIFTPARQLKTGIKNDDEAKPLSFSGDRTCITFIKMFKLLPLVWLALWKWTVLQISRQEVNRHYISLLVFILVFNRSYFFSTLVGKTLWYSFLNSLFRNIKPFSQLYTEHFIFSETNDHDIRKQRPSLT